MAIVKFYSNSMAGHTPDIAILRENHRLSIGELLGVFSSLIHITDKLFLHEQKRLILKRLSWLRNSQDGK